MKKEISPVAWFHDKRSRRETKNGGSINAQRTGLVCYPREGLADSQPLDPRIVSESSFNPGKKNRRAAARGFA
jgi:hypothetical protein